MPTKRQQSTFVACRFGVNYILPHFVVETAFSFVFVRRWL